MDSSSAPDGILLSADGSPLLSLKQTNGGPHFACKGLNYKHFSSCRCLNI